MLNHLLERLNGLETLQGNEHPPLSLTEATGPHSWRAFNSKDLDLPLGQPAAVVLDTLSLIFEAIFAAPELPDAIKTAFGRLQIPILRMAISEQTFFSDLEHPARQLINRMAHLAIGLPRNASRDHPVCASLAKLVESVRTNLEKGDNDLPPLLDELEALIAERGRQIQRQASPYVQIVIEHEATEAARSASRTWLNKSLARIRDPIVSGFLTTHWLGVMQAACLNGGATGELWREGEAVIDELLASFQPVQTPDDRKQLMAKIPLLVKRISAILDRNGISPRERTPFFDACFELQTAAMRSRPGMIAAVTAEASPPSPLIAPLFSETTPSPPESDIILLEQNSTRVQYLGQPGATRTLWQKSKSKPWNYCDWIEIRFPNDETYCGQLCQEIPDSGTLLLFNPDLDHAVATPPAVLERLIENDQACIVSGRSLFDEAAKRALDRFSPK